MGRIAQAALTILAEGPVPVADIGRQLARQGVTTARNPGAAVRRALRDDPRVVVLSDGRLARVDRGMSGVVLTTRVTRIEDELRRVDCDADLAPLRMVGVEAVPLPSHVCAGDLVSITVESVDPVELNVDVVQRGARARTNDERELVNAISARLSPTGESLSGAASIAGLGPLFLGVAAVNADAFRTVGRPLSEALKEAGWEIHLGWVGGSSVAWESVSEEEVDALENEVADLVAQDRLMDAVTVQERIVSRLRAYLPARVPEGRRRLARMLARAGRYDHAREVLVGAFRFEDPEDYYEAALIALRNGDPVSARRWASTGGALAAPETDAALCLNDIAGDLDAQAAFVRARQRLFGPDPQHTGDAVAASLLLPTRSYLMQALAEELFRNLDEDEAYRLVEEMGRTGVDVNALTLLNLFVPYPEVSALAAEKGKERLHAGGSAGLDERLRGLLNTRPVAAWATLRDDCPSQQQILIAMSKEGGRLACLAVLRDFVDMGGAIKDAFFLPDMVQPRLHREVITPMVELGVPCSPLDVKLAIEALDDGLGLTDELGWELPSQDHQPVRERMLSVIYAHGI